MTEPMPVVILTAYPKDAVVLAGRLMLRGIQFTLSFIAEPVFRLSWDAWQQARLDRTALRGVSYGVSYETPHVPSLEPSP